MHMLYTVSTNLRSHSMRRKVAAFQILVALEQLISDLPCIYLHTQLIQ